VLEWPLRAPAGRCHEPLGHGLAVRSGRDRTSVCVVERLAGSALSYDHYQRRSQHASWSRHPGALAGPSGVGSGLGGTSGAATASGGCAAIRRQRLTDETGSPAEPSGFELLVPPSFSQLATQAERRSQSARRESTSLLEGGLGVRIRLAPARSLRTDSPRAHPCLSNPTSVSKGRHPLFVIVSSSSCPTAGSRHSICRSSIFEIGNSRSRAGCLKSSRHR
jgi:hypothetical protein